MRDRYVWHLRRPHRCRRACRSRRRPARRPARLRRLPRRRLRAQDDHAHARAAWRSPARATSSPSRSRPTRSSRTWCASSSARCARSAGANAAPTDVQRILDGGDRRQAGITAPAARPRAGAGRLLNWYNMRPMNLRKTFFILPNLFTLSSVFCGFFAITLCAGRQPTIDGALPGGGRHLLRLLLRSRRRARRPPDQDAVGPRPAARLARRRHQLRRGAGAARLSLGPRRTSASGASSSPSSSAPPARCAWRASTCWRCSTTRPSRASSSSACRCRRRRRCWCRSSLLNHQLAGSFVDVGQPALAHPRRRPVVPDGQPHPLPLVQGSAPVAPHHHRLSRHRRRSPRWCCSGACTRR